MGERRKQTDGSNTQFFGDLSKSIDHKLNNAQQAEENRKKQLADEEAQRQREVEERKKQ